MLKKLGFSDFPVYLILALAPPLFAQTLDESEEEALESEISERKPSKKTQMALSTMRRTQLIYEKR